jgi:hypothetical protein
LGAIFISYRRSDSQGEAGRLFDELVKEFGQQAVFMDVAAIDAGSDFRKAISDSVGNCDVLLALIGPEWLNAADEHGNRRLDNVADYVRLEISAALRRDIAVVPVLLRGAKMPRAEQLPTDVAELSYRNAVELTHPRWKSDVQVLIKALWPSMGSGSKPESPARSVNLDAAGVHRVSRELAAYIGPIAEIVVHRSAGQCGSMEELYQAVAEEIDGRAQREKFLAAVRR